MKHSYPSRDQMIMLHHRLLKLPPFTQSARVRGKQCPRDSQSSTLFPLVETRFWKAIPDTCRRPLKKCFESKFVKSMLFHFPMTVNLFVIIPWSLNTVALFQRIWSLSFNRFVSEPNHRMANQVDDKSHRAVHLNFSTVSDFHYLGIPYFFFFWSSIS